MLDPVGRILLINARDPFRRGGTWWEIPGGGVERHEEPVDAVRRELWEEAGISGAEIGPCVWTQTVEFTFAGLHFDQDEWIHVARCDGTTTRPGGLEALEALAFGQQRWWTLDEIERERPRTIPYRLPEVLPDLVASLDDLLVGPRPPLDITPSSEEVERWRSG